MKIVPAITIRHGRVAMTENGRYAYLRDDQGRYRSPVNLLKSLDIGGGEVFVLDTDGLERNSPDLETVKRMAAYGDIWLDAGVGDAESMMDLFVSDATRVVMGTICMRSRGELAKALDISDQIIFSIGHDRGTVSPDPGIAGMAPGRLMEELGEIPNLRAGLLFDLGGIRDMTSPDIAMVAELVRFFDELYVSGHITTQDLEGLERAGAAGVIIDYRKLGDVKHE